MVQHLYAQQINTDSSSVIRWWGNFGVGVATRGFGGNMSVNLQYKNFLSTFHYCGDAKILGDSYDEFGLLVGYALNHRHFHFSIACGIGSTGGQIGGGIFSIPNTLSRVIGFPFEYQMFYRPFDFFGIGIIAFTVINKYASIAGVTISLQGGMLR